MNDTDVIPAPVGFFEKHRWSVLLVLLTGLILLDGFEDQVTWADTAGLWGLSALFLGVVGATGHNAVLRGLMGVPVVAWIFLIVCNELWAVRVDGSLAVLAAVLLFGSMLTSFWQLIGPVHSEYERLSSGIFGYLLMAMLWGVIYWRIEAVHPGSFNLPPDVEGQRAPFVYFSMITMTTVGYGEMTPAASLPRVLTGLQAIVGTMFVAIFIGRIVGRLK